MNHDERLTGRNGDFFGFYVPKAWDPLEVRQWDFSKPLDMSGSCVTDPACIASYFTGVGLP
jgi:hypothetical protein